jgi:hypothetical protein
MAQTSILHKTKNVLPFAPDLGQKQHRISGCITITRKGKWTNEALEEAMDAIGNGKTSLRQANRHWNIPCISLSNH